MMNRSIFLSLCLCLWGCNDPNAPDFFKSTGKTSQENRPISSPFSKLFIEDNIDLVLRNDSLPIFELRGGKNLLPKISLRIENGVATISNQNTVNWLRSFKPKLEVSVPGLWLNFLYVNGFGEVNSQDTLHLKNFIISHYGQADATIKLSLDTLHTDVNGQGNLYLIGKAKYAYSTIQKFAKQDASQFETEAHDLRTYGNRNIFVNPRRRMVAIVEGSGNVFYKRNLEELLVYGSGSGRVLKDLE